MSSYDPLPRQTVKLTKVITVKTKDRCEISKDFYNMKSQLQHFTADSTFRYVHLKFRSFERPFYQLNLSVNGVICLQKKNENEGYKFYDQNIIIIIKKKIKRSIAPFSTMLSNILHNRRLKNTLACAWRNVIITVM